MMVMLASLCIARVCFVYFLEIFCNTEAITGEAMSSQDLKPTRFAVSAIHTTYVL